MSVRILRSRLPANRLGRSDQDTGGARKVRIAAKGRGRSGGYRIITFFGGDDIPVFLLKIYSKGTKSNLSQAERNELRQVLTGLPAAWRAATRARVRQLRSK